MAIRRTFRQSELDSVKIFAKPEQLEQIRSALTAGKKVEMVESTFKDPTDFCRVEIDGTPALHISGY